ncbi:MAG: nitronate monooxygenase [Rhodospirillales bacterium]|nr:nitronate monooxygenase [Rhodospirillales bacterium]
MTVDELKKRLSLPVIGAPMFLASGVDLVVAQCCAGIVGAFPALNARPAEELENWLSEIETRLDTFEKETGEKPAPYAVNLIVHKSNPRLAEDLQTLVKHKVPLVITSLSAPDQVVEAVHGYGGLVFHDITTRRHAEKAAGVGVDGLILVSAGAGGHAGRLSPFALIPEVKDFYTGAVVLAGAITNGEAVLAAEVLGADFAYIGSAFIATDESIAPEGHKQMVADHHAADVLYTPYFSGTPANYLIPSILKSGADLEEAEAAQPRKMEFGSGSSKAKAWSDVWSAGQGIGQVERIQPTAKYIEKLKSEYAAARAKISG